jgi:hypothetical protein
MILLTSRHSSHLTCVKSDYPLYDSLPIIIIIIRQTIRKSQTYTIFGDHSFNNKFTVFDIIQTDLNSEWTMKTIYGKIIRNEFQNNVKNDMGVLRKLAT